MTGFSIADIQRDFPILQKAVYDKRLVYLDSAASTLKPKPVVDVVANHYLMEASNVHRGAHFLSDQATRAFEGAREKVQHFIHANDSSEIIFTRGTTESINLVAHGLSRLLLKAGDEVIISEMEHHSNIVPWQMACEERDCKLKVVPVMANGELDMESYSKLLSPKTKVVSIAHSSNVLGTVNPVKKIISMAHAVGAKVVVDAAQAVSNQPLNVQEMDCDFLAFSGHKLFGPYGIGVLYGKLDLLEQMPPYQGGGSMIEKVTFAKTTYLSPPQKFEAGTPAIAEAVGLGAAIDYVQGLNISAIHEHELELLKYATERMSEVPDAKVIGQAPQKVSILSFVLQGLHPADIGALLDQVGIAVRTGHHCCQPLMQKFGISGTVRAAFSIYNTKSDVDALFDGLEQARRILNG